MTHFIGKKTERLWNAAVTHLIYEGSKAVVQSLDLIFLVCADGLDVRVNLQVQRGQEALVDSHCCDGGHSTTAEAHTQTHATSIGWRATDVAPTSQTTLDSSIGAASCVTLSAKAGAWIGETAEATRCSHGRGGLHSVAWFLVWHCAWSSSALKWRKIREWE